MPSPVLTGIVRKGLVCGPSPSCALCGSRPQLFAQVLSARTACRSAPRGHSNLRVFSTITSPGGPRCGSIPFLPKPMPAADLPASRPRQDGPNRRRRREILASAVPRRGGRSPAPMSQDTSARRSRPPADRMLPTLARPAFQSRAALASCESSAEQPHLHPSRGMNLAALEVRPAASSAATYLRPHAPPFAAQPCPAQATRMLDDPPSTL